MDSGNTSQCISNYLVANFHSFIIILYISNFCPLLLANLYSFVPPHSEPSIPGLDKESAMDLGRDRDSGSESDRDREDMDDDDSDSEEDSEEERDDGGDGDQRMIMDRQDDGRDREEDRDRNDRHAGECVSFFSTFLLDSEL